MKCMTIDPYLFHDANIYRSKWTTDMFELFPLYIMVLYRYTNKSIMILNLNELKPFIFENTIF